MAKLEIVDDDYASELLIENLRNLGHDVRRRTTADDALAAIDSIVTCDLLLLDIIMPRSNDNAAETISGGRTTGMTVFQRVRKVNPTLPILAYTASTDLDVVNVLKGDPNTTFVAKWSCPSIQDLILTIEKVLGLKHSQELPRSFIVHGRDEATKLAVKNYIQNILNLPEPVILHEQANLGRTLIEKFEHYAGLSNLVFILLTPDDLVVADTATNEEKRRSRQNVIFELGFFLGTLGRPSGRVLLLYKGPLELPSDISGICYIDISKGIEAAGEQIRKELKHVLR